MKISENTINVLKSFSGINKSILVKPGNVIKTMTGGMNVIAEAVVDDHFPEQFAIYELSQFLGAVSLFKEPDFEFFDDHLKISEGKNFIRYTYAEPSMIVKAPDKRIELPSREIQFEISEADFQGILKAASVLQAPEMSVVGEDGTIYVKANNNKVPNANHYSIAVGVTEASFNIIFKVEHLKFMPNSYKVAISSKKIAEFTAPGLTYWVAPAHESSYGV